MTMIVRDNPVETPDWTPPPAKDWDAKRCCPTTCAGICDATEAHIERGDN